MHGHVLINNICKDIFLVNNKLAFIKVETHYFQNISKLMTIFQKEACISVSAILIENGVAWITTVAQLKVHCVNMHDNINNSSPCTYLHPPCPVHVLLYSSASTSTVENPDLNPCKTWSIRKWADSPSHLFPPYMHPNSDRYCPQPQQSGIHSHSSYVSIHGSMDVIS